MVEENAERQDAGAGQMREEVRQEVEQHLQQSPPPTPAGGEQERRSDDGQPRSSPLSSIEKSIIEAQAIEALRTCFDPEIPVNIFELGLIYDVKVGDAADVEVRMTLTTPHCPAAQSLPAEVQAKVKSVHGVAGVKVTVVWDPPWSPGMMSEAAKLELGFF